jgi:fructose-1,6-bisphosphatase/inositol monophosphatase family enzyme
MERLADDAPVWIVDPIDGTRNFAHGRPTFAVMVALARGGEGVAAWILEPVSGRFGVAERGGGAWMGGRRLRVAAGDAPARMTGSLHASSYAPPELARRVDSRRGRVSAVKSLRCAGAEYLRLAAGETQFSLFTRLMPWDHLPGTLIHGEAGGIALCFDGTALQRRPLPRDRPADGPRPAELGRPPRHPAGRGLTPTACPAWSVLASGAA